MNWPEIHKATETLIHSDYQPGSVGGTGKLYQPMGDLFPEMQRYVAHKADAVREEYDTITHDPEFPDEGTVLDWGCSTGYYPIRLSREFPRLQTSGYEKDPIAFTVAYWLGMGMGWNKPDCVILLNVQQWMHREGVSDTFMANIERQTGTVYFQTAGARSGGRYRVEEFETPYDEEDYLKRFFGKVHYIRPTHRHGGIRHLWRCQ